MRSIIKVAIRIILIFLFLKLTVGLYNHGTYYFIYFPRYSPESYLSEILIIFGVGIIGILILILLWWKSDWLVRVLVGNMPDESLVVSTSNVDLFKVAMRIIGIFLIVTAIPQLIGLIGWRFSIPEDTLDIFSSDYNATWIKELLIIIATLIIGLFLALIGGKLATYISSLWNTASFPDTKRGSSENPKADS